MLAFAPFQRYSSLLTALDLCCQEKKKDKKDKKDKEKAPEPVAEEKKEKKEKKVGVAAQDSSPSPMLPPSATHVLTTC